VFRVKHGAAKVAWISRRPVNFYEAGLSQEAIRVDWFTLLFEVIQLDSLEPSLML
jgi:hypothetical protein